jgi:hypothetical protein
MSRALPSVAVGSSSASDRTRTDASASLAQATRADTHRLVCVLHHNLKPKENI